MLVLTAGKSFQPGDKDADEDAQVWIHELQPRLVRLSAQGRQIVIATSGHNIPSEAPEAVIDAVRQVLDEIRRK